MLSYISYVKAKRKPAVAVAVFIFIDTVLPTNLKRNIYATRYICTLGRHSVWLVFVQLLTVVCGMFVV